MAGTSAWRANDVVEYDAMRESATRLAALLLMAQSEGSGVPVELVRFRHDVLHVDGHDRIAVSELAARIRCRIADLEEPKP
ncbi:hypothetical protein B2K11_09630 [Microbacterium sp. B35-30]|nr:hypothetical protein B2K11_09630 [Microbacterium sp. B35-30]